MHRRCCWPPERLVPALPEVVLHLVPQRHLLERLLDVRLGVVEPDAVQARGPPARCPGWTWWGTGSASGTPCRRAAAPAPGRRRASRCPDCRAARDRSARAPGTTSCMRFRQRTKVDLPQPEGPMTAVTCFSATFREMPFDDLGCFRRTQRSRCASSGRLAHRDFVPARLFEESSFTRLLLRWASTSSAACRLMVPIGRHGHRTFTR